MAKQTFTTGQVLTAAQMTSLQQTAMGGGSTTAKTTSYVLVASDAGTVVQMNAAGATTITVNTALFAAGDVVFIQNIGAGVCTVTAGTATVTSAGSLALGQYEGGQLYFNSASASVFFDYVQTGATSPLTTKGDVWGYSTLDARIPIGTNNQVLTADSTQSLGLKWATPTAGSGMTLLSTTTLSGTTTTVSSIDQTYIDLYVVITGMNISTSNYIVLRPNGSSTYATRMNGTSLDVGSDMSLDVGASLKSATTANSAFMYIHNYTYATGFTLYEQGAAFVDNASANKQTRIWGYTTASAAITSVIFIAGSSMSGGTMKIYGVK